MQQQDEVYAKLADVYDPELDEPVTDMGFIEGVRIDGNEVTVLFQLPTYWCSPNFAFIMAEDIRNRIAELPWVDDVRIQLKDHCASDEINQGVSKGKSFFETFPSMSNGDLEEIRHIFRVKTYKSRQERILRHFIQSGLSHTDILNLTVAELTNYPGLEQDAHSLIERYFAVRSEFGHTLKPDDPAFVQYDGQSIQPEVFSNYLLEIRRTRMSMEFNSNYCRGLLQTRYGEPRKENETEVIKP